MKKAASGHDFGRAVVKYFNLPGDKVPTEMKVHSEGRDAFAVSVTILLNAQDLAGIAALMPGYEVQVGGKIEIKTSAPIFPASPPTRRICDACGPLSVDGRHRSLLCRIMEAWPKRNMKP